MSRMWQMNFDSEPSEWELILFEFSLVWFELNNELTMDRTEFTYPAVNLGIYSPNFIGKCGISFFERDEIDEQDHIYIIDLEQ